MNNFVCGVLFCNIWFRVLSSFFILAVKKKKMEFQISLYVELSSFCNLRCTKFLEYNGYP